MFAGSRPGRRIVVLFAAFVVTAGGCSTPGYWLDRRNDLADCATFTIGHGLGARARVGALHAGLYAGVRNWGLRGGRLGKQNVHGGILMIVFPHADLEATLVSAETFTTGRVKAKDFEAEGWPLVSFARGVKDAQEPVPFPWAYYTDIELSLGAFYSVNVGANPGEFVDLLLGFTGLDIYGDDLEGLNYADEIERHLWPEGFDRAEHLLERSQLPAGMFIWSTLPGSCGGLHCARIEGLEFLLEHGADPDMLHPKTKCAPLWTVARRAGDCHPWKAIEDLDASPGSQFDVQKRQVLTAAELLLQHGADPNWATDGSQRFVHRPVGTSSLHYLCATEWPCPRLIAVPFIKLLLQHGADPNQRNEYGETPLMAAADVGFAEAIELLLAAGADPNIRSGPEAPRYDAFRIAKPRMTALQIAVKRGFKDAVPPLLAHGAEPNFTDEKGRTALHYAAMAGNATLVKTLLQAGMKVDARDAAGRSVVFYAASGGENPTGFAPEDWKEHADERADALRTLLQASADVNAPDDDLRTPLHAAASWAGPLTIKTLLTHGADVEAREREGYTPLHFARSGEAVQVLLEAGASLEARSSDLWTPLHYAALKGYEEVVSALIKAGADLNARSKRDGFPLDVARFMDRFNDRDGVIELLTAAGARSTNDR